jgi:paraquat-inducible protein B
VTDDAGLPEPQVAPSPRIRGFSAAWLVPIRALAIAGALAWDHFQSLGPTVRILLQKGTGIEAGRTEIRYRDVTVGVVEEVLLSEGLDRVEAVARVEPGVADALREDTTFWVVRAEVSASGISGLGTLLSGAYLGVDWGDGEPVSGGAFEALESPPRTPPDAPGRRVRLVSPEGAALGPGAPVFFKSIEVGQIEAKRLDADGDRVVFDAFIRAPYAERLGRRTRFWDVSGIRFSLGAGGVSLDAGALVAILRGASRSTR